MNPPRPPAFPHYGLEHIGLTVDDADAAVNELRAKRYNVAQLYARLAEGMQNGKPVSPGFDAAVTRHRLLDAIVRAFETGMKQVV